MNNRHSRRALRIERLEPRLMLAGDTWLVNFQLADAPVPTRYLADTGIIFGGRGGGLSYGWSNDHTDVSRDRNLHPDQRLDTLIHFHQGQSWEFALPNGVYEVTVSIGDAQFDSTHTLNVEGLNYWNAVPLLPGDFRVRTEAVTVADGRLTLDQGTSIDKATRINFVHIVGLPSGPNGAPATPTITEPATAGETLNPRDVHMEAGGFLDADGNAHKSSDWQIWTAGTAPEPVWETLGITGVERLHTHLGDGVFINSHAGRSELVANSDYRLRVRFRDDAGAVSGFAEQQFHTGASSATFPLRLQDVAALRSDYWVNSGGSSVIFPAASPTQSQLRLESAGAQLLLSISGSNGATNSITNPPALNEHADVRVVIESGSSALNLGASVLRIVNDGGATQSIFLPAIFLGASQRLDLWVADDGSTYYGAASQTAPDFSLLARPSDPAVASPFTAIQPGYVVDVVAGGFQLPTNIAFVPNPGPNPSDPLFYVTELYGTIKVVRRDFSVGVYATDLLNFNPTGNFPGSGEQGLAGVVVDPATGDLFATRVTSTVPGVESAPHHPQVIRLTSGDGGQTANSVSVLLDMVGETQGQSHQISRISIGPGGKLYVHMGDGFDYTTALNLNSFRGKILRVNSDGTAPSDNPFYNAADGITARDYVFAYGLRNPWGGAWRALDGSYYSVENGPSVDRMARIDRGASYGWNNTNASMTIRAIYNWSPSHAPVNIDFIQASTFAGSQFPAGKMDHAFVSESGPTYALGPQARGKRIVEFVLDAAGIRLSGPTPFVEYTGTGRGTVVGLAAGPDGLYFTELYKDLDASSPIEHGARIFRVRYLNPLNGDYNINGTVDAADYETWRAARGSNLLLAADGNQNGVVDAADYVLWRKNLGASLGAAADAPASPAESVAMAELAAAEPERTAHSAAVERLFAPSRGGDATLRKLRSTVISTPRLLRSPVTDVVLLDLLDRRQQKSAAAREDKDDNEHRQRHPEQPRDAVFDDAGALGHISSHGHYLPVNGVLKVRRA